jgi:hypothetical protein
MSTEPNFVPLIVIMLPLVARLLNTGHLANPRCGRGVDWMKQKHPPDFPMGAQMRRQMQSSSCQR